MLKDKAFETSYLQSRSLTVSGSFKIVKLSDAEAEIRKIFEEIEIDYYQTVVDTQNDAEILKFELRDLVNEFNNLKQKYVEAQNE
ncbi:MAG: hypothetical protein GY804_09970 [Alphaproteobacteria bacterium]|nr:hypothetical protein [Alphaproteobacteria bacterium]